MATHKDQLRRQRSTTKARRRAPRQDPRHCSLTISVLDPSPERRFRWLLDFCAANLAALAAADRARIAMIIAAVASRWPPAPGGGDDNTLEQAQHALAAFLRAVAEHQLFYLDMPAGQWEFLIVEDERRLGRAPTRRPRRPNAPAKWPGRVSWSYKGPLSEAIIFAAAHLLNVLGAERLLACPFRAAAHAAPCGRLFLAMRRQLFCSTAHSKKAAWQAWLERRGGTRAKR